MTKRQADLFPGLQSSKKYLSDYPLLVLEWHPTKNGNLTPDDCLHKSGKKVWWQCKHGHEWEATIDSRNSSQRKSNCPYYSSTRKKVSSFKIRCNKGILVAIPLMLTLSRNLSSFLTVSFLFLP